jgi:hypothetical protein
LSIRERLQRVADNAGSLKAAADASGVPYRTWQNYVGGKRKPQAEILAAICTRMSVSGHWLLTGEGAMQAGRPAATAHEVRDSVGAAYSANAELAELELRVCALWRELSASAEGDDSHLALLRWQAWLLAWWTEVGASDHAWLIGQLRRHIPDWDDADTPDDRTDAQ